MQRICLQKLNQTNQSLNHINLDSPNVRDMQVITKLKRKQSKCNIIVSYKWCQYCCSKMMIASHHCRYYQSSSKDFPIYLCTARNCCLISLFDKDFDLKFQFFILSIIYCFFISFFMKDRNFDSLLNLDILITEKRESLIFLLKNPFTYFIC